jgi:maleate isomerase
MREIYARAVSSQSCDVVVQLGHNYPMARLVSNLEEDFGRPVLAINSVLCWKMLRQSGIEDSIPGVGSLLFDH